MRLNPKQSVKARLAKPKNPDTRDKMAAYGEELYNAGLELRRQFEQHWAINIAFFAGKQYCYFNATSHTLHHIDPVKGRVRLVDNKILPKVRRQISDDIRNKPTISVVPNSTDDEDIKAAQIGNDMMEHWWRTAKMQKKMRILNTWRRVCGNAFLDDRWNPKKGPTSVTKDPETGEPTLSYLGDVDCGVWSPFEVLVPAVAMGDTDIHAFPWLIKCKWRPLEYIRKHYERGEEVSAEQIPQPYLDSAGLLGAFSGGQSADKTEGAMLKELYIQPNSEYETGKFVVWSNGIVLDEQDYKYDHYNLEHFKDIDVPGIFWGLATMEAAVGLQKVWNRTISGLDEFNKKMAKGKGLVPRNCNIEALPDDQHGEWITYTPYMGFKPEMMDLNGLPQTYDLMLQIVQNAMEDIFSQHEVSRGTNKSDIRSGDMVGLLLEQDAFGGMPSHAIFEESLQATMGRVLERIQAGYSEPRTIKVTGKDGAWKVSKWKGADLRNNTDVHVKSQSSLPDSRVAREATIMNRFERGYYGDPADPKTRRHVQRLMEDAVVQDIYNDEQLDEANAEIENEAMFKGGLDKLLVNDFDNHSIHAEVHDRFRKSREFQKLKETDMDEYRLRNGLIDEHVQMHQKFIREAQEAQMKQMVQMEKMKKGT